MRQLFSISFITIIAITVMACGGSSTGPEPDNNNNDKEPATYSVSVDMTPSDAGTISPSQESTHEEGEEIELLANPSDAYVFAGWTGDLEETDNPLSFTVDQDYEITANFEIKTYDLVVSTEGEGAVSETVIEEKSEEYDHGTVVELAATPAEGYRFVEWQGDITGSENPQQITVDSPKEVTAVFEKKSYPLTVNTDGEGTVNEQEIVQKANEYNHGAVVELAATPAEGWRFVEWQGDLTGTDNPAQITVDNPSEVTAVFARESYSLTVHTDGEGVVSEQKIVQKANEYDHGTVVELAATPAEGWRFVEWQGDLSGTDNPARITVDNPSEVTAVFARKSYPLTVHTDGEGVVSEQEVVQKANEYNHGTVVELIATPTEGWRFVEWQGDLTGSDNPQQITVDNPKEVTAVFEKKSYPLTILTDGQGAVSETVIQQKTTNYDHGTVVELEANPSTGWEFIGWQGDLTGSQSPAQVTVTQSTTITAVFELLAEADRPVFYLAENGVTIKCEAASVGDTGTVDGEEYTKRIPGDITTGNAPTTCTSGIMTLRTMFRDSTAFNGDISHWDVSSVTDMSLMFYNASSFNQDIGDWDVSGVVNMSQMFQYAASFNQNIGDWDVSGVEEMGWMFRDTDAFNQDIGGWDVSSVTDMRLMFYNASSFNQDIGDWDVSSVTNMYAMFQGPFSGTSSFNADISEWDVSGVENMGKMFQDADTFNQDIGGWDVSSVTDMSDMFRNASSFNQDIGSWDVSNVTEMAAMFYNATVFDQNLTGWCVSNISSEPTNFSIGAAFESDSAKMPVWGTCPTP